MITTEAINLKWQSVFNEWYENDKEGNKRIGGYINLTHWLGLIDDKTRWGWVVFDSEIPFGFIDLELMNNEKGGFSFYVAPDFRGKGFSNLLIQELIKKAKEKQINILYAGVEEDNIGSIKILLRNDFKEIGRDKDNMIEFELNIT